MWLSELGQFVTDAGQIWPAIPNMGVRLTKYATKPLRFLQQLQPADTGSVPSYVYCAGFQLKQWRSDPLATHLIEWLPDYALTESELDVHHGNAYEKLRQAAVRVYSTVNFEKRGEAGEISLHAICRDFFDTVPISQRVFYKSTSNDVVKAFDMVHARVLPNDKVEIWLGESKFYEDGTEAIKAAIASIKLHLDAGFLQSQKLILGPQIPEDTPNYQRIRALFESQTSLDELLKSAVFVVGIFSNSKAVQSFSDDKHKEYVAQAIAEAKSFGERLTATTFPVPIRLLLVYIPLESKPDLASRFDRKLKGLQ